jgi:hypothetical protein
MSLTGYDAGLASLVKTLCAGIRSARNARDWESIADLAFAFEHLDRLLVPGTDVTDAPVDDDALLILGDAEADDCGNLAAALRGLSTDIRSGSVPAGSHAAQLDEAAAILEKVYIAHHPGAKAADPRCTCDPSWSGHGTQCPLYDAYIRGLCGSSKQARP